MPSLNGIVIVVLRNHSLRLRRDCGLKRSVGKCYILSAQRPARWTSLHTLPHVGSSTEQYKPLARLAYRCLYCSVLNYYSN